MRSLKKLSTLPPILLKFLKEIDALYDQAIRVIPG